MPSIIAVMLGRLRMSIDDCEKAYLELSKKIFTPRRSTFNLHRRALDFLQVNGRFDATVLENCMKSSIEKVEGKDALLRDPRPDCKV